MAISHCIAERRESIIIFTIVLGLLLFHAIPGLAQITFCPATQYQGSNTVYGICSGAAGQQGSLAFIDAYQFSSGGTVDLCASVNSILSSTWIPGTRNVNGVVIDARGFKSGTSQSCAGSPWPSPSGPFPNIVLLPAGTITITSTWVLPSDTRLVGQGPGVTTVKAASGLTGPMIQMGSSTICTNNDCQAVVIEHLGLDGNLQSVIGILNQFSQELSWVNDVSMVGIPPATNGNGIGLSISTASANNSGPYTNINFTGTGTCANINSVTTRGIHGLTCTTTGTTNTTPAVYLDGINNSLEDITINGASTQDGILIGSNALAQSNVLFNVRGSGLNNVIELSTSHPVTDLTILSVTNSSSTLTVKDNLVPSSLADSNLALYVVGDAIPGSVGYSRFTTSPNNSSSAKSATWIVGTSGPSSTCATGSLYSITAGTGSGTTLWGCTGGTWSPIR